MLLKHPQTNLPAELNLMSFVIAGVSAMSGSEIGRKQSNLSIELS